MRFADLDAVTVDGFGTLLTLAEPGPALAEALRERGVERDLGEIAVAFAAEVAYYRPRSHLGRDETSLAALRRECVGVFLESLRAPLDADSFVDAFIGALRFEPVPGVAEALERLGEAGLRLGVVANWDRSLHEQLARLGLDVHFDTVVTSADAGVPKPDPRIYERALAELGTVPRRAAHVGNEPVDEEGARAAGMRFLPAPLATAFDRWT
jgi:putative hydrolase of the HAD superfamily